MLERASMHRQGHAMMKVLFSEVSTAMEATSIGSELALTIREGRCKQHGKFAKPLHTRLCVHASVR
eukprot:scaffold204457_cov18-Tisochrysis_lutea.AAC.6